jgi:hypothetical protein
MGSYSLKLAAILLLTLTVTASGQEPSVTEEIPIGRCDRLPVVTVRIDGSDMRFLVDTAATSMLNLKTFSQGRSKEVGISSWSGTRLTSAREVTLPELALGSYRLRHLRLPAIDLSLIAEACGGPIDGILGVDLLERMGATIDLKNRVAVLGGDAAATSETARLKEFRASQRACVAAFNRGDAEFFENCIDPDVVLLTPWGEVRGRQAMLDYLRQRYFSLDPPARLDIRPRDFRVLGNAVWFGYDYTMKMPDGLIRARGMAICRKGESDGRYRLLNMHNSVVPAEKPRHP